jgi:hypothetical protein
MTVSLSIIKKLKIIGESNDERMVAGCYNRYRRDVRSQQGDGSQKFH